MDEHIAWRRAQQPIIPKNMSDFDEEAKKFSCPGGGKHNFSSVETVGDREDIKHTCPKCGAFIITLSHSKNNNT